jgi:hypothetical protein
MVAREIHLATGQQKAAVDQVDDPVREIAGEEGSVVRAPVFAQPAGYENFRITIGQGQLDVGVSLVVAQQDIEAWFALLDEIIFKRQASCSFSTRM